MHAALTVTAATESLLGRGLLIPLGGVAALLAMLGMLLLLPIFLNQRREIARLTDWMNREPDAGTTRVPGDPPPPGALAPRPTGSPPSGRRWPGSAPPSSARSSFGRRPGGGA